MEASGRDYPMDEAVIISAVRTPIGKYGKALAGFKATELGGDDIIGASVYLIQYGLEGLHTP